jgi:predicted DNA-binding ribbon-helix-helix protein
MPERPKGPRGKSLVRKRSIKLDGHKTSVTIEDPFWTAFKEIAAAQRTPVSQLIATIDSERRAQSFVGGPSVCPRLLSQ